MTKQLLTEQEAVDEVRRIVNSVLGKRWMVAVWCVDEAERKDEPNLLRLAGRTTWQFPPGDFEESLRLLREHLEGELRTDRPPVPTALEMAPFLLGDGEDGPDDEEVEVLNLKNEKQDDLDELFQGREEE